MTRARNSANLASQGNLFVDIANDRTGIGSVVPAQNLHVAGTAGFHADTTFVGDLYNATWDRSDNSLKFVDNAKIKIGTGGDLEIYHQGNVSYIDDTTGNQLSIQANDLRIRKQDGNEEMIRAIANGTVRLFYNGEEKLSTIDKGIKVGAGVTIETNGQATFTGVTTFTHSQFHDYVRIGNPAVLGSNTGSQIGRGAGGTRPASLTFNHGGSATLELGSIQAAAIIGTNSHGANNKPLRFITGMSIGTLTGGTIQMEIKNNTVNIFNDLDVDGHTNLDNVSIAGVSTFTGDLTVDTNTFHVDSSNNRIGVGIITPARKLHIHQSDSTANYLHVTNDTTGSGVSDGALFGINSLEEALIWNQENDNIIFGTNNTHRLTLNNSGHLVPASDSTYNLGSNSVRFANVYGDALYGVIQNTTHTNITRVGTLSQLAVSGTANPLNVTHTGANCVNLNRGSKSIGIDVNYGDSDTHSLVSLTTGMDLRFKLGGADRIVFKSAGHIEPQTDSQINLGSNTVRFANLYADTLYGDGSNLTGVSSVGGSTGVDFSDDILVRFGNANDLQLYHNSGTTANYIDSHNGRLYIRGSSNEIKIQSVDGEEGIIVKPNGATELYHDNEAKVLTQSNGATVQDLTATGAYLSITSSSGNNGKVYGVSGTDIGFLDNQNHWLIKGIKDGAVELYWDNTKKFETYQYGIKTTQNIMIGTHAYWEDNGEANFGDNQDFQLYHNGSHSYIDNHVGHLYLRNHSTNSYSIYGTLKEGQEFGVFKYGTTEWLIRSTVGGSTELWHDGSKKLHTISVGLQVTGNVYVNDGNTFTAGDSNDGQYFHNGTDTYLQNSTGKLRIGNTHSNEIKFFTNNGTRWNVGGSGHIYPDLNNAYDIGTTTYRVRNIYTNDLNLSNEGSTNSVDNTWGNYTIQEGESDLFLINNRNGKKYKFNLTEVS